MRKRKFLAGMSAAVIALSMLASCGKAAVPVMSEEEITASKEMTQNDYRGGVIRTKQLGQGVLDVMTTMKQNNVTIRTDNPNSFWTQEGYQDFVVDFLNCPAINDTEWFNEEEMTWEETYDKVATSENSFTKYNKDKNTYSLKDSVTIKRNEKDDYSVTFPANILYSGVKYEGVFTYHIFYDCDKDWCKAYTETNFNSNIPLCNPNLYEYARIDADTFAIQTSKERLVIVLEPADGDTDIKERKLKEFYYSKLTEDGERTTFEPFTVHPDITENGFYDDSARLTNETFAAFPFVNEKGDLYNRYGKNDSMFLKEDIKGTINGSWVLEDKSLQQAIIYKDGALVVVTYNKLTEGYERFVYTLDGVSDATVNELIGMIEIKDLVGTKKAETTEPVGAPSQGVDLEKEPYGARGATAEDGEAEANVGTIIKNAETTTTTAAVTEAPAETVPEAAETQVSEEAPAETSAPTEETPAETQVSEENPAETPAETTAATEEVPAS